MVDAFTAPGPLTAHLPELAGVSPADYERAIEDGMAGQRAEVDRITASPGPGTFDDTLLPLELSGRPLARALAAFFTVVSADGTDELREVELRLAPRLAAHQDAIRLDPELFARIGAVHERRQFLAPEARRLAERYHREGVLAGAALDDDARAELSRMNGRLAELSASFDQHLVADTNDLAVHVEDEAQLAGLGAGERAAARQAAADRGLPGWLITLVLPSDHPWLSAMADRGLRRRVMAASLARGSRGGEHDTRAVALEIVRLRARRARLLGFANHAELSIASETAPSAGAVADLLARLVPPAVRNAREERAALERRMRDDGEDSALEAADWAYYAEREREARFELDTAALRPWFDADRVLTEGVFYAAHELYGLSFAPRTDLAGYAPDVRVFEVTDEAGGLVGLYLLDLHTRDTKRGGAWMQSLVERAALVDEPYAVVVNNLNAPRPPEGEPTLLTLDLAETLFHEFGHALHGLLASTTYPSLAGTSVPRDFVEFPSQVNEQWLLDPQVAARAYRHAESGEPLPDGVLDRIRAAQAFGEGFATTEYLAAAVLDQAWHRLSVEQADAVEDVLAFEASALAEAGFDVEQIPPRYRTAYFQHVFSSGYAAAYYAYIWSEVLDADAVEWFREQGGLRRDSGARFAQYVLGVGDAVDPIAAYREFRGRDAAIEPLLTRRGLA